MQWPPPKAMVEAEEAVAKEVLVEEKDMAVEGEEDMVAAADTERVAAAVDTERVAADTESTAKHMFIFSI